MNVLFSRYKKQLLLIIVTAITSILVAVLLSVIHPTVNITVNGDHDPVNTSITINGNRLAPTGDGGRAYSSELSRFKKHTISIKGQSIASTEQIIDSGFAGETMVDITTQTIDETSILKNTLGITEATYSDIASFRSGKNIVASEERPSQINENESSYRVVFIYFDTSSLDWKDGEVAVSSKDSFSEYVSQEALNYYYELGND